MGKKSAKNTGPRICVGPDDACATGICAKHVPEGARAPFCSPECQAAKKAEGAARAAAQKATAATAAAATAAAAAAAEAAAQTEPCRSCGEANRCVPGKAHCRECSAAHSGDFVVLIKRDGTVTTYESEEDAEDAILALLAMLAPILVLLDLHGVTDTIDPATPLGYAAAVVSYVGKHSTTRYEAQEDCIARGLAGQILFGVLVFKRGKRAKGVCQPTKDAGSKAWFCSLVKTAKLFVDDSDDHVKSVEGLEGDIKALLFDPATVDEFPLPDAIARHLGSGAEAGGKGESD
jgi:hypothetical protein